MLPLLLLLLLGPLCSDAVELAVSINGLPLSARPFVDPTDPVFGWPPRLSWHFTDEAGTESELHQHSYSVSVDGAATAPHFSSTMTHVLAPPARSNTAYTVALTVTLSNGLVVRSSGSFRTALLQEGFGNATWISGGTLLSRDLSEIRDGVKAEIANATIFASGVGCFAIRINGRSISNSFMDPGWATLPTKRVTYRAYDVTSQFANNKDSSFLLTVALGMCKYGYQNSFCVGAHGSTATCKAFIMSLHVSFADGTKRVVVTSATDRKWMATTTANPIRYSHLYHGEQYDGRAAAPVTSSEWQPAAVAFFDTGIGGAKTPASQALGKPTLLTMPALEVSRRYIPVSVTKAPTGAWVFDMGDNMAGFAELSLPRSAFAGPAVPAVLKYAEVLNADGTANMAWCGGKEGSACDCTSINCANQTDTFIPAPPTGNDSSEARVYYTPSFTYHGFRYVQVEGLASGYTPTTADMTGLFVHSSVRHTGNLSFPTSPVLDGIQRAIVQTQLSNLHFHPTDCPQREKRGWTGDAQFTSIQASLNFDMRLLYGHWLQTMRDHDDAGCAIGGTTPRFPQTNKDICCYPAHASFGCDYTGVPNGTFTAVQGSVADVVPFMYVGGWPGDPSWGAVATTLPHTVWRAGGDDALVAQFYDLAKRNVDFFNREADPASGGLIEFGYYGDWLALQPTAKPQVVATAQIRAVKQLVDMAAHLRGHESDVAEYNATLTQLKQAYHTKYWNASAQSYRSGSQTANLMPLILDIPPTKTARVAAAEAFVASVEAAGNATESGLVGASFVLQALVAAGRGDIALNMAMRDEEPSWGYMVAQGPGTIWETWNDKSNSHNHPMFTASIGPYLYQIVGLDPAIWEVASFLRDAANGNRTPERVTMQIAPDREAVMLLHQANGRVETACGPVAVAWRFEESGRLAINTTVPHNCGRARIELPVPPVLANAERGLCFGSLRVGEAGGAVLASAVVRGGSSAEAIVGGGRAELVLSRCQALQEELGQENQ